MRRLLAIIAFFAGTVAAEMAQPVQCTLLHTARARMNHRKE